MADAEANFNYLTSSLLAAKSPSCIAATNHTAAALTTARAAAVSANSSGAVKNASGVGHTSGVASGRLRALP